MRCARSGERIPTYLLTEMFELISVINLIQLQEVSRKLTEQPIILSSIAFDFVSYRLLG